MKKWHYPFLLFLIIATVFILKENKPEYKTSEGAVFGTIYHITYNYNADLSAQITDKLLQVDNSLSTFNKESTISRVNTNCDVVLDSMFLYVYNLAREISDNTGGAFDITVAPAVNAWGFGFKNAENVTDIVIDSLKQIVDYRKVTLSNGRIVKQDDRIMLDCSAIAKGFGCDAVAALFDSLGVSDYMVEIGGEIVLKGNNTHGELWRIGISKPIEDSLAVNGELQTVLAVTDKAMATSGNYRNYYYKDGKRYAHTIDPKTCRPVNHNLLSVSVLAENCATADAYATAMMVMGLEKSQELCNEHPEIEAYFIYQDSTGAMQVSATSGFSAD
ncbi:MAG: FAD:protein FMN transferase [Bacteroidaceae bacterium]|nr:FAD:protein FMN transferase [Bacteroidaceae bacterium]